VLRRRGADQDGAAKRDRATGQQSAREALAEHDAGQERDQKRAEVDEHGRGPRVDAPFRLVQRDVVEREPEHAAEGDRGHVMRCGQRLAPQCDEHAESDARDREPPERKRFGRQLARSGADGDECGRPERDGDQSRREGPHTCSNGAESRRVRRRG
jgi:hypothetical protein